MTDSTPDDGPVSKNRLRAAARTKARKLRDDQRKKDRRSRYFLQGGVAVVILAVVAIVILVIVNGIRPPSPGPKNMLSDGIKIGQGYKAVVTPALGAAQTPEPSAKNAAEVIDIQIYLDYQCPICGDFEATNAAQIKSYLKSGAATIEIHPIAILDNMSLGKKYSSRAANAAACVANFSPNSFFDYSALLFADQPKENTEGLTDAQLIALAKKAQTGSIAKITRCVDTENFSPWVAAATTRAATGPIARTNVAKVTGTPTVIINGIKYLGALDDKAAFAAAIVKANSDTFAKDSTSSASPSPSPTP